MATEQSTAVFPCGHIRRKHARCYRCEPRGTARPEQQHQRTCVHCGVSFKVAGNRGLRRRVCSTECLRGRQRLSNNKHRPAQSRRCVICGKTFRQKRMHGRQQMCCSRSCGVAYRRPRDGAGAVYLLRCRARQQEKAAANRLVRARQKVAQAKERTALRAIQRIGRIGLAIRQKLSERRVRGCDRCDAPFVATTSKRRFCSHHCARRTHKQIEKRVRRARQRGCTTERINPTAVFKRDRWRCGICGLPTQRKLRGQMHPDAPELDHIIPLASPESPGHVWANVQCAHRRCNGAKGARPLGQPRLV
jgi:5-methylcytosine-specific restriction endonuclease McrA